RFLVITATFPPRGGSSVQRVAKFCKYAKRLGAEPVVITARFDGGLLDETLMRDLPRDLEVHHVTHSMLGSTSLLSRVKRRFARRFLPDEHGAWGRAAYRKARHLAQTGHFDAVFVSYGSPSALRAGIAIGKMLDIPVVTDIRDFKQKDAINRKKIQGFSMVRRLLIGRLERSLFPDVSKFSVVSKSYAQSLSSFYDVRSDRIEVIYNGYDADDFRHHDAPHEINPGAPVLRYVGFVTHIPSFRNLVAALSKLNDARLVDRQPPVRLEIYGENRASNLQEVINAYPNAEFCAVYGYVPHDEAVRKMLSATALILLQHGEAGVLTGKLFEYIGAARPILLLHNDNYELKALVEEHELGPVAEHDRPGEIKSAIENILAGKYVSEISDNVNFQRAFQAEQFLKILNAAVTSKQGKI
ncbi:glycosyltransferase, partial [Thalassococcus sp. BH17M4-6]